MKKLVLTLMLFCGLAAWAQQKPRTWSITPKIGLNISSPTNHPPFYIGAVIKEIISDDGTIHQAGFSTNRYTMTTATAIKSGWAGGVEVQYQFNSRLGISLGAYYSQQGVRYDNIALGDVPLPDGQEPIKLGIAKQMNAKTDYITMSILLNCYVYKGLALKVGLQPAYNVVAEARADLDAEVREGYWIKMQAGMAEVHKLDVTVPVGLSYDFPNGLVVDLRYHTGIGNLYSSGWEGLGARENKPKSRTSMFQLTVGYKFEL